MRALVFHGAKDIRVEKVPDPSISRPEDAIVRVTSTAICGSDLHIYNGFMPQPKPLVMGHEFMGVVEEVGAQVTKLKKGDRVVVPFAIGCGRCWFCKQDLMPHCEMSNPGNYGPEGGLLEQKGGGLFGYTEMYGGYDGGQAEYVRVPYADVGPRVVPEGLSDEDVLFLTDILPTGWSAVDWAQPRGGETYVVFGAGPVGLMAMKSAWARGAERVFAVDIENYRLELARKVARAETINSANEDAIAIVRGATQGRGADIAIDAVGLEAHRSIKDKVMNVVRMQAGSIASINACVSAVRRGGAVSIVGVYGMSYDAFPIGQIFDKGLRIFTGQAHVHRYIDHLLGLVASGALVAKDVITHRLALEEGPRAYQVFNDKQDRCEKVVLKP
jgi:S-(hydroxymethyl)glutathione dehydrogenase/alcohol dehydrogenase